MRTVLWKVAAGIVAVATLVGVGTALVSASGRAEPKPPPKAVVEPAAPRTGQEVALQYVPRDAAIFIHVDIAKLWGGAFGKSARLAEPKMIDELARNVKDAIGVAPDGLESATAFWPSLKGRGAQDKVGMAFTFRTPVDVDALTAGVGKMFPKGTKFSILTPTNRVAIVLAGLDKDEAKPTADGSSGPLAAALREASSGRHLVVVGGTPSNMPEEIRGENLPPEARPFNSIFNAESVFGMVDLEKAFTVELRVKSATPAGAAEAEKALGLLSALLRAGLAQLEYQVGTKPDQTTGAKDLAAVLQAAQTGVGSANFSTEGSETRVRVALPGNLQYGKALISAVANIREAAGRTRSINNLKQIAIAMHNSLAVNDTFPPAAVVDKTGKPLLSWRVLILPYLEQDALFKEFHLDEPWDSVHNKKLIDRMPQVYSLPDDIGTKKGETHYRVFVGKGAGFDLIRGPKITEITDGTSNTIMVVTAAESVPWTKPDDLPFDPEGDPTKLLLKEGAGGSQAAFFDGSVMTFPKTLSAKSLKAMITRAGGEPVDRDKP